jgi:DnaJ family protein C protein 9
MNPYQVLGLSKVRRDYSASEITKAYRLQALQFHPDRNPDGVEAFKQVGHAYAILSDPVKRQLYDEHGVVDNEELSKATEADKSHDMGLQVAAFYASYRGSQEEKDDLLMNYQTCNGDLRSLITNYALFDNGALHEVRRIRDAIVRPEKTLREVDDVHDADDAPPRNRSSKRSTRKGTQ